MLATIGGFEDTVRELLRPEVVDHAHKNAIVESTRREVVPELVGMHVLHIAAVYNRSKAMRVLLECGGFDVNVKDTRRQCTALHFALMLGNYSCAVELLKHGWVGRASSLRLAGGSLVGCWAGLSLLPRRDP